MPRSLRPRTLLPKSKRELDEHAVTELSLFIENTGELYPQLQLMYANLRNKIAKGRYDNTFAPKLFRHLVERGVRMYGKEFRLSQSEALRMFPPPERNAVALLLAQAFEADPNGA